MNMNIDFQDRIDDYVLGRMPAEDRSQFEKEISQDNEKKKQLELTLNIKKALASRQEKLAMIHDFERNYQQQRTYSTAHETDYRHAFTNHQLSSSHKRLRRRRWFSCIIGIAAILTIGFFITYTFTPSESHHLTPVTIQMENVRGDNSMTQIARMVNNKQYEQALRLIQQSELENQQERDSIISHTSQSKELIYILSILNQQKYDLIWMKANTLIGLHQIDEATRQLQKLRQHDNTHQSQADSLFHIISK